MPDSTRGSIYISTADEIGETLVGKLGGSGYTPNEWDKALNLCGISDADIPTALENIEESADGTERGSFEITKANSIASILNKKFKTTRGFKPKEWASAIDKLTALQVKNASGAIASFSDGADDVPIASASFSIVPYQNLNGYSKPWASGCGKNKFDAFIKGYQVSSSTGAITENPNGAISDYIPVTAETAYYISGLTNSLHSFLSYYQADKTYISRSTGSNRSSLSFTTPALCAYVVVYQYIGSGDTGTLDDLDNLQTQLELGSSATAWEPYSNVCPITPYSQMTILQQGYNFFNEDVEIGGINDTTGLPNSETNKIRSRTFFNIKGGLTYYVVAPQNIRVLFYTANETFISETANIKNNTFTAPTNASKAKIRGTVDYGTTYNNDISINYPSNITKYHAFKTKSPIVDAFGRSVYGGSRASDGTLTDDMNIDTMSSTYLSGLDSNYIGYEATTAYFGGHPSIWVRNWHYADASPRKTGGIKAVSNAFIISMHNTSIFSSQYRIYFDVYGPGISSVSDFISAVQRMEQDNTPLTICYEIASPTEYALDPLPEINSYYGDNNIYTDIVGGESSVNYRADIDLSQ